MSDRFPFMRIYKNMADKLPTKEDQADFYKILVEYALDDIEPEDGSYAAAVFEAARMVIDKWKLRKANGEQGGRPRTTEDELNDNLTETKEKPNQNQTVTKPKPNRNQTETKEEKKKSIKDKKKEKSATHSKRKTAAAVVSAYNDTCSSLPKVAKLTDARIRHVLARLQDHSPDELQHAFMIAEQSDFLAGRKSDWHADFDWLMNENNLVKVLEGNYTDTGPKAVECREDGTVSDPEAVRRGRLEQKRQEAALEEQHKQEVERWFREHPGAPERMQSEVTA